MSAELYDIVFRGDILPGHQLIQVKQRLAQLFKADEARINALFVGGAVPLKRNLDKAAAEKYQAVLRKAGADVQVAPAGSVTAKKPPQRKPRPARTAAAASQPTSSPAPSSPPAAAAEQPPAKPVEKKAMTLQERLAATEKELAEKEAKRAAEDGAGNRAGEIIDPDTGWSIAAVGSDVLKPEERQVVEAVEVDVSDLSLRESQGNLVDEAERPVEESVEVDVSAISLADVGEDLLPEDEKTNIPLPTLEVDDFGLAPVGSDMGQIKPPPPPPEPDTSGISLE
ncbi:hypothetical protein R50073_44620 [Maricurvus nonylphenolicus]|uniref:hypothetical protein n=1 Tax=Maricurvus nonylphenolicus TaxID=1008307 RepID=UPI0036F40E9B